VSRRGENGHAPRDPRRAHWPLASARGRVRRRVTSPGGRRGSGSPDQWAKLRGRGGVRRGGHAALLFTPSRAPIRRMLSGYGGARGSACCAGYPAERPTPAPSPALGGVLRGPEPGQSAPNRRPSDARSGTRIRPRIRGLAASPPTCLDEARATRLRWSLSSPLLWKAPLLDIGRRRGMEA